MAGRAVTVSTPVDEPIHLPLRTCVGCRERAPKPDLLRVVLVETEGVRVLEPDPRGRRSGRGAHLHPDLRCLDLAERRRAFPRAFRLPGPLDASALRRYLETQVEHDQRAPSPPAEAGERTVR